MKQYLWIVGLMRPIDHGVSKELAVVAPRVDAATDTAVSAINRERLGEYVIVSVVRDREVAG